MTDTGQVLVAAIVTLALESPIAGIAAQTLSKRVVQPLLRTVLTEGGAIERARVAGPSADR